MCGGGAARREHHRQQEQMREETRIRDAMEAMQREQEAARRAEIERMSAMQTAAETRQQEAMKTIADVVKAPVKVKTMADAATPILRTRQKTPRKAKGVASLRINRTPSTNISAEPSGGTNLG